MSAEVANCTYLCVVPRETANEQWLIGTSRNLSTIWAEGSEKSHSKWATSRQCSGTGCPRMNGDNDHPSAWSGTSAPMNSQMVGSTSTDSVTEPITDPRPASASGRGSTTIKGTW